MFIKLRWLSVLFLFPLALTADIGDRQGNGGDEIRAAFFRVGRAVLAYLNDTERGRRIVVDHRLSPKALADTLTIKVVSVTENQLVDRNGRRVDSLAERGSIQLRKQPWLDAFSSDADVYSTVFYLMLRAAGEWDDGGVSRSINPFPERFRVSTKVDVAKDTSLLPHAERYAYLNKRGQLLVIRLAGLERDDLLYELVAPRRRLKFDIPATVGPGQAGRWVSALDEVESSFNAIEAKAK